ncbi:two component regulator propeller family protein (macronuclear) [Tetrahymena thermophila SB210]|uniref:Two component regulator propeller family protein n=1 Tax=Tetrahymena thermophila (strain SB210) TaxID=312017 RepID=W7XIW9_TETTS|nr:two component regulator propeller family protein [Tetrahymena thermophila SB210]EWS73664.1 two component regulator propeller family protein [Tetrahymena thermophila SB210]|eukprot:XP_012653794.1 two component regulator propeller family protein [Tetrahymena thermophila SB210]
MSYFQIAAILSNIIFFVSTQGLFQSQQQSIFQALPKQVININENQPAVPTQMLIIEDSQLIIFISKENYIGLFDEKKDKMKVINTSEQVQSILIFDNQQYLLAAMITYTSIYQIQLDKNNDYFLAERQTLSLDLKVICMLYLPIANDIFILSQHGVVTIYQNLGNGNIQKKNKFQYDKLSFLYAQVTQDERFMFCSLSLKDIVIFQIEKNVKTDGIVEISNLTYLISIYSDYWIVQLIFLNNFIYYIDSWQGLYFADLLPFFQNPQSVKNIKPTKFGLGSINLSPTTYCMVISSDQKYLYLGVRSQGILIYDISNISNPIWYYQLFAQGQAYCLIISNKGQALYYSNSNGLYQYQQTEQSFTNKTPNMYNSHKSKSLFEGPPFYKWRCQILQKSNALFVSFDVDYIQRFQIIKNNQLKGDINLQKIDILPYAKDATTSTPYIENVCIDKNEDYLYIPVTDQTNIILKYQIPSSINSSAPLQYKQSLQYSNVQYAESLKLSQDNRYMVVAYSVGVMIVDIEKFEVLSLLSIQDMQINCYGAEFTRDTNYIFATARNIGVWIINAKDKQNPFVIQALKTKAAETVKTSNLYDIMYCLDGFNGLLIFDTSALPNVVILSNLKLQGWVNHITLLSDENFGIISTMDAGMLSLVNLKDKSNPILVSSYQIGQQNSQSTCVDPSMQYLLILNSQGIRYFPLDSDVLIHHEFSIKQFDQNSKGRVVLSQEDFLLVGQTYELRLIPLYQQPNQLINNIFIYQNEQKQALPSWINQINKLYLEMTIPKEAVSISNHSIITLLVQTQFSLNNSSFIQNLTSFVVSPSLSSKIYQYLKTCGFINSQDLVTDLYNPEVTLNFNDFGNDLTDPNQQIQVLKMARNILQNSIDYSPIQFKVQSSLNYILDQKKNSFQVHSFSNQLSIQFSFSAASSLIFVQKEYPNVISYRDDQNTTLNIQSSSVESINNILRGIILYHIIQSQNNDNINNQYQVNLLIQDGINSNINELQSQIEKISNDSTFAIESTFIIQFDRNTFIDPDGIPLSYSLLIYINNNYSSIHSEYFLKFDEQNLRMTGTPQASNLFEIIHLRLVVSNGYNQLSSDFYIKIYNISFTYLLNLLLKYIGPVAFILGIYRKKITLIENELVVAQAFLKEFQSKNIFKKQTIQIQKDFFGNQCNIISLEQIDPENSKFRPSFFSNSQLFNSQIELNSTQKDKKNLSEHEKKRIQTVKNSLQKAKINNFYDQDQIFNLCYSHPQIVNNLLSSTSLTDNLQYYNQIKLFNIKISADKLFSNMIQNDLKIMYERNYLRIADYTIEYYNNHSRFNYCLNAQVVDYLLQLDIRTNIVYSYLKEYSKKQKNVTENDWYKAFVQIESSDEIDCTGTLIPFSNVSVNESSILNCLSNLDLYISVDQPFDEIWLHGISPVLLKQALIFESLGLLNNNSNNSIINKSKGESIFILQHQILSVEAFQLKKQNKLNFFQKMLNLNYERIPISKYQYLPNWIQLDCKSGIIILEGIPTSSDHEEILIRIYNLKNYIIRQFNLKILSEQPQELKIGQNIPLFQTQNKTEITKETPIIQGKFSMPNNQVDCIFCNSKKSKIMLNKNPQQQQEFQLSKQIIFGTTFKYKESIFTNPIDPQIQKIKNQPHQDAFLQTTEEQNLKRLRFI